MYNDHVTQQQYYSDLMQLNLTISVLRYKYAYLHYFISLHFQNKLRGKKTKYIKLFIKVVLSFIDT